MTNRVLVIEDEKPLRLALVDALVAEGLSVVDVADGEAGLRLALEDDFDAILLDLMLPGRDGFSVLRALREDRLTTPILILSARGEEWDRVQGFEYGADDYITKPYSSRELILRLRAAIDRSSGATPGVSGDPGKVRVGDATIDFAGYSLTRDGRRFGLSRRELDLLRYLIDHEGEALERSRILDDVWGEHAFPTARTIDTHVRRLRKKLEADPDSPRHLLTVHGVGYRLQR